VAIAAGTALLKSKADEAQGKINEESVKKTGGIVDPYSGMFIPLDAGPGDDNGKTIPISPTASAAAASSPSAPAKRNNPVNLRSWNGVSGPDGYAHFGSDEEGFTDAAKQLELYGSRDVDTLQSIISKWAPAKDRNNVPAYSAMCPSERALRQDSISTSTILPSCNRFSAPWATTSKVGTLVQPMRSRGP
jgi:hypothetical protein